MYIGSCGHELTEEENNNNVIDTKDYTRLGEKCIITQVVCDKCLNFYKEHNLILFTIEDKKEWFETKILL